MVLARYRPLLTALHLYFPKHIVDIPKTNSYRMNAISQHHLQWLIAWAWAWVSCDHMSHWQTLSGKLSFHMIALYKGKRRRRFFFFFFFIVDRIGLSTVAPYHNGINRRLFEIKRRCSALDVKQYRQGTVMLVFPLWTKCSLTKHLFGDHCSWRISGNRSTNHE